MQEKRSRGRGAFALLCLAIASCAAPSGRAPNFALSNLEGAPFQLSDHLGRHAVLMTFWSTSCDECQWQMPVFSQLQHDFAARGLVVVAIATDGPKSRGQVRQIANGAGVDFEVLLDESTTVLERYNAKKTVPTTVLVGADGVIHLRLHDFYFTGKDPGLVRAVEAALPKEGQADAQNVAP